MVYKKKRDVKQRARDLGLSVSPTNPLAIRQPRGIPPAAPASWRDQFFMDQLRVNNLIQGLRREFGIDDLEVDMEFIFVITKAPHPPASEIVRFLNLANFHDISEDKIQFEEIPVRSYESQSNRFCVADQQLGHSWSGLSVGFIEQPQISVDEFSYTSR